VSTSGYFGQAGRRGPILRQFAPRLFTKLNACDLRFPSFTLQAFGARSADFDKRGAKGAIQRKPEKEPAGSFAVSGECADAAQLRLSMLS
jgi:hypothetical protein